MEITQFISPKQLLEIKREIAEQALVLANPIVALEYKDGITFVAENPSQSLRKISEIYDRIVFAGTGVYDDYERLRKSGVQYADVKGFSYSRRDVKARALATEYSHIVGEIFSKQNVPLEVEILLVELGEVSEENRFYLIPYSGGLIEESGNVVVGDIYLRKETKKIEKNLIRKFISEQQLAKDCSLREAITVAFQALSSVKEDEEIKPENMEIAVLDRTLQRDRKFRRCDTTEIRELLSD